MKILSEGLKNHLSNEVTTLATCWKIKRKDQTIMGFTDFDKDIKYNSIIYKSSNSFTPSAIASNSELSVDNLDIEGVLDSSYISEKDINSGLYDYSEIEIFMLNYNDLTQGSIDLKTGWLGEIKFSKDKFIAEIRGLVQNLSQGIGDLYSPLCRAKLGDDKCKVDLNSYQFTGNIVSVENNQIFTINDLSQGNNWFTNGVINFITGENANLSMEIKSHFNDKITLVLPLSYNIQVGDEFTITAGCSKTFDECIVKFDNAINFRGEPRVPGTDKVLETAGTRNN